MSTIDPDQHRARIIQRILNWGAADIAILDALTEMGPPSALHAGFPDVPGEHDTDPGGVPGMRRNGGARERALADVLHAYRAVGQPLGLLPAPGK